MFVIIIFERFSTGSSRKKKARINRKLLKKSFGINSQIQLDSLRDALVEKGYYLIELDYSSDLFLVNIRNFIINTRNIDQSVLDSIDMSKMIDVACTFLKAQAEHSKLRIQNDKVD